MKTTTEVSCPKRAGKFCRSWVLWSSGVLILYAVFLHWIFTRASDETYYKVFNWMPWLAFGLVLLVLLLAFKPSTNNQKGTNSDES